MIRWYFRKLRRKGPPVPSAERQKQLWLAGASLDGADYSAMCPCCVGLDGIDPRGSTDERDVLEDMGFNRYALLRGNHL
jgi:hypothetical protein